MRLWSTIQAPGGFSELQSWSWHGQAPNPSRTDPRTHYAIWAFETGKCGCTGLFSLHDVEKEHEASKGRNCRNTVSFPTREMVVGILSDPERQGKRQVAAATSSWAHISRIDKRGVNPTSATSCCNHVFLGFWVSRSSRNKKGTDKFAWGIHSMRNELRGGLAVWIPTVPISLVMKL